MIQIQATITGYGGRACSLFSAFDTDAKVLIVGAEAEYRAQRRENCIVLTNDPEIQRDSLFSDADLRNAISAFFSLKSGIAADGKSSRIAFSERAARANPEQSIEKDGIDAGGQRFRVAEGVTCGQIAALATCLHALRADTVERTVKMAEAFKFLAHGGILTI